jgi:regulator of replication initiation timing
MTILLEEQYMIPIDFKSKDFTRHFFAICLCLSIFACQPPSQNEDAQVNTPDMQATDAQTPIVDAQTPIVDAQTPIVDAQTPIVDAQTPIVDAQTPIVDAQTPIVDAQTPIVDAQTPIVDAYIYPTIDLAILPDAEIVDMAVDLGPTGCVDDFSDPRPVWNQIVSTSPNIPSPYPDYHTVSNNFNIVKSIQLLASIFTKAMKKLEDVKDIEGTAQNLLDPDEAQGHCICNSCGSNFNVGNAQDIWNHVETQLNQIVQDLPPILEEILEDKIEALQDAIDATLASLSNTPNQVVLSISGVLQTQSQQVIDYYNMNCAPPGVTIDISSINGDLQVSFGEVQTAWDSAFSSVQTVITTIKNGALSNLWNQVQTLWQTFSGVQGLGDLVSLNWSNIAQQVQTIVSDITPLINQIQTAITQVTNLYNTIQPIAQQIAQNIQNTLANLLSQNPNLTLGNCNLQQMLAPLNNIAPAIEGVIQSAFQQSIDSLNQLFAETQTILLGNAGGNSLAQLANQLAPIGTLITSQIEGCHMKGSSAECVDYCEPDGVFFWGPVDFFKDPTKAAGSMALMALRQLGWLDQIAAMLTDANGNQSNPFLDGINSAIGALGNVATFLENMAEIIANLLAHVDTFTEGYHLG